MCVDFFNFDLEWMIRSFKFDFTVPTNNYESLNWFIYKSLIDIIISFKFDFFKSNIMEFIDLLKKLSIQIDTFINSWIKWIMDGMSKI